MAASVATIGFGATLKYHATPGTSTFTSVAFAELLDADFPTGTFDLVEVTHQASPNQYREFVVGLKDGPEHTFEGNYIEAEFEVLRAYWSTLRAWQVQWSSGSGAERCYFDAWVRGVVATGPINDRQKTILTLKIQGPITYATT